MAGFTVPGPELQPFNVQPVATPNPLGTLAQMRQLQAGNIALEQKRMEMDSNRAMMEAFAKGKGDPDETYKIAAADPRILPDHLLAFNEHRTKLKTDAANLAKLDRENLTTDLGRYRDLMLGATDQTDMDTRNQRAAAMGISDKVPRITQYPQDAAHLQGFLNSLIAHSTVLGEQAKEDEAAHLKAQTTLVGKQTEEAGLKVDAGQRAAAASELQTAPTDASGNPTPAAAAAIAKKYPKAGISPNPTLADVKKLIRSTVPKEKLPEYDQNQMMLEMGLLGKDQFDQYMWKYGQGLNPPKTPLQMTPEEFRAGKQQYSKDSVDPSLFAATLGLKTAQELTAKGQASTILTTPQIQRQARQLLNGDLSPDQIKDLRAGRVNQGGQIIDAAQLMSEAEGKPFSLFNLQQQATLREETAHEFGNTGISHAGGQKLALNTLIHHADLWMDAAAALKNGNWRPGNAAYNAVASAFGKAPPLKADLVARFLAGETGKVATGGVPGEGEVNGILANLKGDIGPEQIADVGTGILQIAAGRMIPLRELRDKYRLQDSVDILGPDARETLIRRGYDPETMKPVAKGSGQLPRVTTQAQYDALPKGASYIDSAGVRRKKPVK